MITLLDVGFMLVSLSFVFFIKDVFKVHKKPIFGIYQQPSSFYWFKVWFMYLLISLKQLRGSDKKSPEELDRLQELSQHDKAVDAVYLAGGNSNKDYFVIATARRKYGLVDGFFYLDLKDSNLGLLSLTQLPDTTLHQENDKIEEFGAEGIKITPIEPMKKWKISYEGKMKNVKDNSKVYDVQVDVEWNSELPYFNFHTEINAWSMAKAVALENWSLEYFQHLKKYHQVHYEQPGEFKGTALINGISYPIAIDSIRDHSFGNIRDWKHFHRYALHLLTTEDGDRISIGNIIMPVILSNIIIGFVYNAKDKKNYSIDWCDFKLYQHGEIGDPPVDYAFSFIAGGKYYSMQVKIVDKSHFYISKEWECKVYEMPATFQVNGKNAWGISEWCYRNTSGRNIKT